MEEQQRLAWSQLRPLVLTGCAVHDALKERARHHVEGRRRVHVQSEARLGADGTRGPRELHDHAEGEELVQAERLDQRRAGEHASVGSDAHAAAAALDACARHVGLDGDWHAGQREVHRRNAQRKVLLAHSSELRAHRQVNRCVLSDRQAHVRVEPTAWIKGAVDRLSATAV